MSIVSSCKNTVKLPISDLNIKQLSQCQEPNSPFWFQSVYYDPVVERILLNVATYNFTLLISLIKYMENFVFKISSQEIN